MIIILARVRAFPSTSPAPPAEICHGGLKPRERGEGVGVHVRVEIIKRFYQSRVGRLEQVLEITELPEIVHVVSADCDPSLHQVVKVGLLGQHSAVKIVNPPIRSAAH